MIKKDAKITTRGIAAHIFVPAPVAPLIIAARAKAMAVLDYGQFVQPALVAVFSSPHCCGVAGWHFSLSCSAVRTCFTRTLLLLSCGRQPVG